MKCGAVIILTLCVSQVAFAQIPTLPPHAIFFQEAEGGWDLYIRKMPGIGSIVLTESQRDPTFKVTTYGLRSIVKTAVNADEKRILDGRVVKIKDATCYMIDSTPEEIPTLGEFYHFFLTNEVVFGYSWSRNGRLRIAPGVRINLRLFEKPYGDYRGRFIDQWIVLTVSPLPVAEENAATELAKSDSTIVLLHPTEADETPAPTAPETSPPVVIEPEPETATPETEPPPATVTESRRDNEDAATQTTTVSPEVETETASADGPREPTTDTRVPKDESTFALTERIEESTKAAPSTLETTEKTTDGTATTRAPRLSDRLTESILVDSESGNIVSVETLIERLIENGAEEPFTYEVGWGVVEILDGFPYETPVKRPYDEGGLLPNEERVAYVTVFRVGSDAAKIMTGRAVFHFDEQDRLTYMVEYDANEFVLDVMRVDYEKPDGRPSVTRTTLDDAPLEHD
ncbi:MAG TPA: hypothetical protein ENN69_01190 [Spirochaetia bacterium]|nr:hypothetical protein [Spirochaetia bacterium]